MADGKSRRQISKIHDSPDGKYIVPPIVWQRFESILHRKVARENLYNGCGVNVAQTRGMVL